MKECNHKNRYTEKEITVRDEAYSTQDGLAGGIKSVYTNFITTYCADCGLFLKRIEMKPKK